MVFFVNSDIEGLINELIKREKYEQLENDLENFDEYMRKCISLATGK